MSSLEGVNTLFEGMQSDSNKFDQNPSTYLEALNFRIITDLGQSNRSLVNIKGNDYMVTIPNTQPVYRIKPGIINTPCTITINGVVSPVITTTSGTLGFDIYQVLVNMSNYNIDFFAAYYQDHVTIWSETLNPTPILSSLGLKLDTQYGTGFWVSAQTQLIPIGTTYIRDDIYVFTTPQVSNPNTAPNSGQIFKLTFDIVSKTAQLKLLYNEYINFDLKHPIPYTAAHGRYESDKIQRIYWTDNYNKLRSINASDPNLMALPVFILDIFPQVQHFIPTLTSVQKTGSLPIGVYQYAYRYKKSNGQITLWSELSLPIAIYNNVDEGSYTNGTGFPDYASYVGQFPSSPTGKSITCTITKVDSNFDFMDICFVRRYNYTDPGHFEIFNVDIPVVSGKPAVFTHTGNETNNLPLTLLEFLQTSPGFTHCKTIDTKDNRLFAGNVRVEQQELKYDARAYQFPINSVVATLTNNGNNYLVDSNQNFTTSTSSYTQQVPDTDDAINSDYNNITPTSITNTQRFYPNSTIPGGKGPNIEFKVRSWGVHVDIVPETDFSVGNLPTPWRHTNQVYSPGSEDVPGINLGVDGANYPQHSINDSFKTVYKSFLLRGYTPNEIYRFGIQFYDKSGSPYFCKWIGDIRMPDYNDDYPAGRGHSIEGFNLSFGTTYTPIGEQNLVFTTGPAAYMQVPYLEFKVNVSSIIDKISGFEIVRTERTYNDRFIAGTGCLYQCQVGNGNASTNLYIPDTVLVAPGTPTNPSMYIGTMGSGASQARDTDYTFDCWDFNTENVPPIDLTNDRIHCAGSVARVGPYNGPGYVGAPGTLKDGYYYSKHYAWTNHTGQDLTMEEAIYLNREASYVLTGSNANGFTFNNFYVEELLNNKKTTVGNPTLFVGLKSSFLYSTYAPAPSSKIFAEYRKYGRLITQYGGRTYADRANSIYISCGMYVPVNDISIVNNGNITIKTFGGDTFYDVYTKSKGDKNNAIYTTTLNATDIKSFIHYNPHIGYHNSDVRTGTHFDYPAMNSVHFTGESFDHFKVYSAENNIKKFFPKPLLFNNTKIWDNRVYFSEVKINGETSDNWEQFKANNYWDVEGSYGPINSLIAFNDTLYYIQKKGFGKLYVNPMALIPTGNFGSIVTGLGNTIQRHDYISTDIGTNHQWSVTRSPNSLLFVDSNSKKVFKYSQSGLLSISDAHGQSNTFKRLLHADILKNDNPILHSGIHCTYDNFHDEYLITILNEYTTYDRFKNPIINAEFNTISFNEKVDRWNSFYSFTPTIYFNNKTQLWSPQINNTQNLYVHNDGQYGIFYGITYPSTVKLVSNHNGKYTKLFNNLIFNTETILDGTDQTKLETNTNIADNTFDRFRAYNDYQNTDYLSLVPGGVSPTLRRVERQWNLQIPRNKVLYSVTQSPNIFTDIGNKLYGERMRDKYLTIDLSYNNNNNYRLIFNNLITKYLISDR